MDMNFYMPVHIIMGEGSVVKHRALFSQYGNSALIVTGGNSAKLNGSLEDVITLLESERIEYRIYDKVTNDPSVQCAREGARQISEYGLDMVIAIGGGSAIDAGKAMALLCRQPHLTDIQLLNGEYEKKSIPLIAIPTTSGAGSETTPFAMLTSYELGRKINVNSNIIYPKIAFLDPRYTLTLPRQVTVNAGIDAISHAMEGMLTITSTPYVRAIAKEALSCFARCLIRLQKDDMDFESRERMMYGCALAGITVGQTRTSALHGISYPLGFYKHIPHGRAIGLLMLPYLRFIQDRNPTVVDPILEALRMQSLDELSLILKELVGSESKNFLSDDEIKSIAAEAANSRNIRNSLVPPNQDDIIGILREIGRF